MNATNAINTVTFTFDGTVETARWTYERDEDAVYPIPVHPSSRYWGRGEKFHLAMWAAIHAAAARTPPVRV